MDRPFFVRPAWTPPSVSAGGNFALRRITENWLKQASVDGKGWTFYPARQLKRPIAGHELRVGDVDLDLGDFQLSVELEEERALFHVLAYHPVFEEMDEDECRLPRQSRSMGMSR